MKEKFFLALARALIVADEATPGVLRSVGRQICQYVSDELDNESADRNLRRNVEELTAQARLLEAKAQLKSLE